MLSFFLLIVVARHVIRSRIFPPFTALPLILCSWKRVSAPARGIRSPARSTVEVSPPSWFVVGVRNPLHLLELLGGSGAGCVPDRRE